MESTSIFLPPTYTFQTFANSPKLCKKAISRLTEQIVQLYDVILEYFQVTAENEVGIPLSELPRRYNEDIITQVGYRRSIEDMIQESQNMIDLTDLAVVRAEMKIWKKLWKKWGKDTKFIPWKKPFFLSSDDPETWVFRGVGVEEVMDDVETLSRECLRCESQMRRKATQCEECFSFNVSESLSSSRCYLLVDSMIYHLGSIYTFLTDNDISLSADTYRNRCTSADHAAEHWNSDVCTIGNWSIPPRIRKYIESYPDGFATLDTISNIKLRKYIIKELLTNGPPDVRFKLHKIIGTNPMIMGKDFDKFLAISEHSSGTFSYIRQAVTEGNIDWLDKIIYILLKNDYPPGSSYKDIQEDMVLEREYLDDHPLPLKLAIESPPSENRDEIISFLVSRGGDLNKADSDELKKANQENDELRKRLEALERLLLPK